MVYSSTDVATAYGEVCRIWGSHRCHVKWVPRHHGMARPQVPDGGDGLQIRKVPANILNKQTADMGWSFSLWGGRGVTIPHRKNSLLRNVTQGLGLGRILRNALSREKWRWVLARGMQEVSKMVREIRWDGMDWIILAQDGNLWRALVNTVWTFQFSKMLRNSWVAERLAASEEVLGSMELVHTCGYLLGYNAV
jgi:hypothetical protein